MRPVHHYLQAQQRLSQPGSPLRRRDHPVGDAGEGDDREDRQQPDQWAERREIR
jgi:hypothetical protein